MLTRRIAIPALTVLAALSVPVTSYADDDPGGIECGLYDCEVEVDVPGQGAAKQAAARTELVEAVRPKATTPPI